MKKWLINSLVVIVAWTYIIPVQAMFLSPQAKKRSERMRRTTRTTPSSTTSSLYEPELTESGAGEVGEKSPEPVGTTGPIEQPSMLSQGWQAAQQTASAAQQKASSLISSAAAGAQQGSAAVQRKLSAMVNEIRSWSYQRVAYILLAIASAIGATIIIKNSPHGLLDTLAIHPSVVFMGSSAILYPLSGRYGETKRLERESNLIGTQAAGLPLKSQGQYIQQQVQATYNASGMRWDLPAQQKLLSEAEAALVKRMKDAMVAHAQVFPEDMQSQEVINFYNQHNLEDNGELAHQAYNEAWDELGFARADV